MVYLLKRSVDEKEELALVHLQQSFKFEDIIQAVAAYFGVDPYSVLTRASGNLAARRLSMNSANSK